MADKEPVTAEYSGAATGGSATETTGAVLKQYDNDSSIEFYRRVMGGGTLAIHYGVYGTPGTHTSVAVARYQKLMCDTLDTLVLAWRPQAKILDLGSGAGGPAHAFAARFAEASLTCCNICPEQNQVNMGVAGELGLASRMECFSYDFNQPMPAEWAGKYDAVYSVEAFCHASDKEALIKQVYTMLKPGGVLMFSDIMMSDEASEEDVINFTKTNAGKVAKPKDYIEMCSAAGLAYKCWIDLSDQLPLNFAAMHATVERERDEMLAAGVDVGMIDRFAQNLPPRVKMAERGAFAWGIIAFKKPELGHEGDARGCTLS